MKTYCNHCGHELSEGTQFCHMCGKSIDDSKKETLKIRFYISCIGNEILRICKQLSPKRILSMLVILAILFLLYHFYQSYKQTQIIIAQTSQQLASTEAKLSSMASSTATELANETQELNQKNSEIAKLQGDSQLLSKFAPSVVKIICNSDAEGQNFQEGSGVLYHPISSGSNLWPYFIETNLHVVQTSDGSPSSCVIAVYPDYTDTYNYLAYDTTGYQTYKSGVDLAYLVPGVDDGTHGAPVSDLGTYAKNITSSTFCSSSSIGDSVSILGYPGVGGSSLTATNGIISGYEYDSGVRFIKTSAEIEHGNSGGVAIENSGCILGIPTFVDQGEISSIGRILDINALLTN